MSREAATAAQGRLAAGRTVVGSAPEMLWNVAWIVGVPWLILISIAYWVWKRRAGRRAAAGLPR